MLLTRFPNTRTLTELLRIAMLILRRTFSAAAKKKRDPTLSLDYFIETSKSKLLWRYIVRASYQIPKQSDRKEMLTWARSEFERHKNETDPTKIKYLVSTGTKEAHSIIKMIGGY